MVIESGRMLDLNFSLVCGLEVLALPALEEAALSVSGLCVCESVPFF